MADHRRTVLTFLVDRESHLQGAPVQIVDSMEFVSQRGRRVICDFMVEPFQCADSKSEINHAERDVVWWRKNTDMVECVSVHPPYEILARFRSVHEAAFAANCTVEHLSSWLPASLSANSSTPIENMGKLLYVNINLTPFCGWKYASKSHPEQRLICYDNYFSTGRHLLNQSNAALVESAKRAARLLSKDKKVRPTDVAPPPRPIPSNVGTANVASAPSIPKATHAKKDRPSKGKANATNSVPPTAPAIVNAANLGFVHPPPAGDSETSASNSSSALARSLGLDLVPSSQGSTNAATLSDLQQLPSPKPSIVLPAVPHPTRRLIEARSSHGEAPFEVYARFSTSKAAEEASGVKGSTVSASCTTAFQKSKPFHITTVNPHYGWAFAVVSSHSELPLFDNYFANGRAAQDLATKEPPPSALAAMRAKKGIQTLLASQAAEAAAGERPGEESEPSSERVLSKAAKRRLASAKEPTSDKLPDGSKPPNPPGVQLFYHCSAADDVEPPTRKRSTNSTGHGRSAKFQATGVHPSLQNAHYDEGVIVISPTLRAGLGHPANARALGMSGTLSGDAFLELGMWDDKLQDETDDSDSD